MFRRVLFEDWQSTLAAVLFVATCGGFICYVIGSWRMKAATVDRLAHLPLQDDSAAQPASRDE